MWKLTERPTNYDRLQSTHKSQIKTVMATAILKIYFDFVFL